MAHETVDGDAVEIVEEEGRVGQQLVPAPRQEVANLFGGESPVAVVERATEVAKALAAVIEDRQLYKMISGRKHVVVEGWTLLGSMLGVFPVVEWTRKLDDAWEAKVEARTRAGEIVGSAEAMCSKAESKWKSRDEYAIRSMAQTRAVSKALRLPLGFVMTLAGYDATPHEEMDLGDDGTRRRPPAPADPPLPPPDPVTLLPTAFATGGSIGELVGEALRHVDPSVDWRTTWEAANVAHYGKVRGQLLETKKAESLHRLANVADRLTKAGDFPPPSDAEIVACFAECFGGVVIEIAREDQEPEEPTPLSGVAIPEVDDSIEFGDASQGS